MVESVYDACMAELKKQGAYLLSEAEKKQLATVLLKDGHINPVVVGQSAVKITELANLSVPADTKLLLAEINEIGVNEPFSYEKLSPILGVYQVKDFKQSVIQAQQLLRFTGAGHTAILYTQERNRDRIEQFGLAMQTARILINIPGSQGAIGDIYNFYLEPSLTLGCGSYGKNSVSGNIKPEHLLNMKTVAERRENMLWFRVPPKIFFKYGCLTEALSSLTHCKRAFIITDRPLFELNYLEPIEQLFKKMKIHYQIFSEVTPDPTLSVVEKGLSSLNAFKPDVIIAMGGGSPMDAAKIMWLMHDNPELKFSDLALRFMDIRKRIVAIDDNSRKKTQFVAIPTTSGTGSEVSPFCSDYR